jgi:hypothetical protein
MSGILKPTEAAVQNNAISKADNAGSGIKTLLRSKIGQLLIAAGCIGGLNGCADDREVYVPETGTTSNDGNGGNGGTSTGTDTGTDTGTGGTDTGNDDLPVGENVEGFQVLSFNMYNSDAYDTFDYYADKAWGAVDCMSDPDCVKDAYYDVDGRPYQWLTTSKDAGSVIYDEQFNGELKGFCVFKNDEQLSGDYTVEAGENCKTDTDGWRECKVAGVVVVEQTDGDNEVDLGPDHKVGVAYGTGDHGSTAFCFGSEHAVYIKTGGYDTMSYSPEPKAIAANNSLGLTKAGLDPLAKQ